jgi:hypothetical protein
MSNVNNDFLPGEKILWQGKPDPAVIFSPADAFLVPFSLVFGSFVIFWLRAVMNMSSSAGNGMPGIFGLFGLIFLLASLYFIFGRFMYKAMDKASTDYFITDKRVLIIKSLFSRNMESAYLNQVPVVNKKVRPDGHGSLIFGNQPFFMAMYANSGWPMYNTYGVSVPAFYDIRDADRVYDIFCRARDGKS